MHSLIRRQLESTRAELISFFRLWALSYSFRSFLLSLALKSTVTNLPISGLPNCRSMYPSGATVLEISSFNWLRVNLLIFLAFWKIGSFSFLYRSFNSLEKATIASRFWTTFGPSVSSRQNSDRYSFNNDCFLASSFLRSTSRFLESRVSTSLKEHLGQ